MNWTSPVSYLFVIHSRSLFGKVSKQSVYKSVYNTDTLAYWFLYWYGNSDDVKRKPTEKQKCCFCCSHYWPHTYICLQSDSVYLEQVTTLYDCFQKVTVQFFPTDTKWKGGTLDKSFFILELGQITVQFDPPTAAFSSYLV